MENNSPRPDVVPPEPRVCNSPLDGSTDDMSDKEANKPILFRCLLLLLPVAIPVVVYLKDIDAMRRIFLTAFILLVVIVFSCMMVALLRKRRRHLEGETSNSEIARELAHRHLMAMTHRFLPRQPLPHSGRCSRDCGVDFTVEEFRRPGHACRTSYGRFPGHYHLASTRSRSPSPQAAMFASGALPLLSLHFPRLVVGQLDDAPVRSDDPPPYEDAILCPPSEFPVTTVQHPERFPPETPPPSYDSAVA